MKLRRNPTNQIIYVHYENRQGRRAKQSTGTRDIDQAKAIIADLGIEKIRQMEAGPTCEDAMLEWEAWMHRATRSKRTIESHVASVTAFLRDHDLLEKPVTEVSEQVIEAFINDRRSLRSTTTRDRLLTTIRRFLEFGAAKQYILGNPAKLVSIKSDAITGEPKQSPKRKAFTEAEIKQMLAAFEGEWRAAIVLAMDAGLRLGHVCNLEWDAFDLKPGRVVIWTDKRDRRVSLPLTPRLRHIKKMLPRTDKKLVLPEMGKTYREKGSVPLSVPFSRELARMGIEGKSFHSLRVNFLKEHRQLGKSADEIRIRLDER